MVDILMKKYFVFMLILSSILFSNNLFLYSESWRPPENLEYIKKHRKKKQVKPDNDTENYYNNQRISEKIPEQNQQSSELNNELLLKKNVPINIFLKKPEIKLYSKIKWGLHSYQVLKILNPIINRKRKYTNRYKKRFLNPNKNNVKVSFIYGMKVISVILKSGNIFNRINLYFLRDRLLAYELTYRPQFVNPVNIKKEIFKLFKNYGNYKKIALFNEIYYKWVGLKTRFVLNVKKINRKPVFLSRFYFSEYYLHLSNKLLPKNIIRADIKRNVYLLKNEIWYKPGKKLSHKIKYEYNGNNQPVKETQYNSTGQIEIFTLYKYLKNKLASKEKYTGTNNLIESYSYKYRNGQAVECEYNEYGSGKKITRTIKYKYGINNVLIKEAWLSLTGRLIYFVDYKYNEDGKVKDIKHYSVISFEDVLKYKLYRHNRFYYKHNGNIKEYFTLNSNGKVLDITEYFYQNRLLKATIVKSPYSNYIDGKGFVKKYRAKYFVIYKYDKQ